MHRVHFISFKLRDEIASILHRCYVNGVIPHQPTILDSETVQVEGDQLVCESAIRRIRVVYGGLGLFATYKSWESW
jgi:hypothetical protein